MPGINLRIVRNTEEENYIPGDYALCFEHDEVVQEGDNLLKVFKEVSSNLRMEGYKPYFRGVNDVPIGADNVIYHLIDNGSLQMVYDEGRGVNMYVVHVSHVA
ncbi:hypothetical protein GGF42_001861 [Coemansia sp. RSA 2424]|nr:hypothetical protein GGF42_001861 [Coemansia sp. RSA 2424]